MLTKEYNRKYSKTTLMELSSLKNNYLDNFLWAVLSHAMLGFKSSGIELELLSR